MSATHVAIVLSLPSLTRIAVHHVSIDPQDAMEASMLAAYCGVGATRCRDLENGLVVSVARMDDHLRDERSADQAAALIGTPRDRPEPTVGHDGLEALLAALGYDWSTDSYARRPQEAAPAQARSRLRLVPPER